MENKKKIMVFSPPLAGHVNPMCCFLSELRKYKNVRVIFFNDEKYRELATSAGVEFRAFSRPTLDKFAVGDMREKRWGVSDMLHMLIDVGWQLTPQFINELENEKPDLIIYDPSFQAAKYAIEILRTRHKKGISTYMPRTAGFIPSFPFDENFVRKSRQFTEENLSVYASVLHAFGRQMKFSWHFGIPVYNPLSFFMAHDKSLNIVGVPPEIQPNLDCFNKSYKFVGGFVSEQARSVEIKDDSELKAILDEFDNYRKMGSDEKKLIAFSMGTVFNNNLFIYESMIEAVNKFDRKPNRRFRWSQLKIVMSVGDMGYQTLSERSKMGSLKIPNNLIIRAKIPQLEVLKRADLFVTHCGWNSSSETVKYAVPIVAIPLEGDQPVNAIRLCDELEFGVRLNPLALNADEIADSIDQVLGNDKYKRNISAMSETIKKYNGPVDGAKLMIDYLYDR